MIVDREAGGSEDILLADDDIPTTLDGEPLRLCSPRFIGFTPGALRVRVLDAPQAGADG